MKTSFVPPTRREFDAVFSVGESAVRGGGIDDIRIFLPPSVQRSKRGGGIFTVLSGLAKRAIPFLMRTIAPEAVRMSEGVLGDVLEGRRFRDSLKNRGVEALKGVRKRIVGGKAGKTKRKRGKKQNKQLKRKMSRACYKDDIFHSGI